MIGFQISRAKLWCLVNCIAYLVDLNFLVSSSGKIFLQNYNPY